jgi:hypothetical protein
VKCDSLFTINDTHPHSMSNLSKLEQQLTERVNNLEVELSLTRKKYYQLQNQNTDQNKVIENKDAQIRHLNTENQNMNEEIRRLGRLEVQLRLEIINLKKLVPTQPQNGVRNWR